MFLMWLGEQITERGLGNGISIVIFSGIVAGLPSALGRRSSSSPMARWARWLSSLITLLIVFVTALVVFVERGQRRILVNYAKRQVGNKMFGGQSSYLPLKLNMSGVIPPIFASRSCCFPRPWPAGSATGDARSGSATWPPLAPASRCTSCCMRR